MSEFEKKSPWISCKNRMPPQFASVLAIGAGPDCFVAHFDGEVWRKDDDDYFILNGIKQWMIIPEPPTQLFGNSE